MGSALSGKSTTSTNDLEQENAVLKQRVELLTRENAELKQKVARLERENAELKQKVARLERENAELRSENAELWREIRALRQEVEELRSLILRRYEKPLHSTTTPAYDCVRSRGAGREGPRTPARATRRKKDSAIVSREQVELALSALFEWLKLSL